VRNQGAAQPAGALGLRLQRANGDVEDLGQAERRLRAVPPRRPTVGDVWRIVREGLPSRSASLKVNLWRLRNQPNLWRGAWRALVAAALRTNTAFGVLRLRVLRGDGSVEDLGVASMRVVTTAGVGFIVDAFQNLVELENMKFHGLGTGTNAEASSDTALQTELTTAYNPDNTRATGTTTESAANIYRTVGTNTFDASAAVTEHGVLSQAATGGGVLIDRSVFSAVNVVSGDSLESTYDFTINAGG
jgi:hypothetical protein